ncbi:MAG: hypothetical protein RJA22_2957 [Verrucomicrobiota bacterium]
MQASKSHLNLISRRSFLDRGLKTGAAVALGTLMDIPLVMKKALAEGSIGLNGKKVLFIWLRGANDGLNSLIPALDPAYSTSRPTIGIPLDPGTDYSTTGAADFPTSGAGSTYGSYPYAVRLGNGFAALHPSLKFMAPVYNAGDLALIHRVAYPSQSRSHFDSQRYWENGLPDNNLVNEGIFYRAMLEHILDQGANASPLTGVSIQSSLPLILRGSDAPMTNLTDPLRYDLLGIPNSTNGNTKALAYLNAANKYPFPEKRNRGLLSLQYQNLSETLDIFGGISTQFTEAGNTFRDDEVTDGDSTWAAGNGGEGYYLFPTTGDKNGGWRRPGGATDFNKYAVPTSLHGFFNNLKAAAVILNKTDAIVAGTEFGGFDTHNIQGQLTGDHPNLNRGFGWAMYALRKYFTRYADKATWNDIVVVTLTEFGRTTIENTTQGTDHAEAGAMFVAGGAIKGYNATPGSSGVFNCNPNDTTVASNLRWATGTSGSMFGVNGRYLKRTTDFRQVLGEVIRKHLGATQNQLNRIIPGYASESTERLLAGGTSYDGTLIRGELGLL